MKKLIASLIATIMVVLMIQVPCFAAEKVVGDTVSITFSGLSARTVSVDMDFSNMKLVGKSSNVSLSGGGSWVGAATTGDELISYVTLTFEITGSGKASYKAVCSYGKGSENHESTKSDSFDVISKAEAQAREDEKARQEAAAQAERDRQAQAERDRQAAERKAQQQENKNNNNDNQQENLEEVPTEELPQEQPEVIAAPVEQKPKSDFKFRSIPIKLHEMLIKAMEQKTEQLKKEQEARINAPEKTEAVKVAEVKTEEIKEEVKEEKTETANKVVGAVTTDNGGSNGGNFLANVKLGDMAIVAGAIIGGCLLIMTSHLGKSTRKEKQNHLRERV